MVNLSESGTANCYIVSAPGSYMFTPTKGNSTEQVGLIVSADVLWESFGTDVAPSVGDLVAEVKYEGEVISFSVPKDFKEGNAVIAAYDDSGNILWSWHVWLTDQPQGQVYYNDAGTMMDRNLGATSATPGELGTLGLLYQWGRKDPFLGTSVFAEIEEGATVAKSTVSWPSPVESDPIVGTIEYTIANPTTFIAYTYHIQGQDKYDWYYTEEIADYDNTRWATSDKDKSIYDPCPVGWRLPDGGEDGVWGKAFGPSYDYSMGDEWARLGMDFSGKLGADSTIWYPFPGIIGREGELQNVGIEGAYLTATPEIVVNDGESSGGCCLYVALDCHNLNALLRVCGGSIRCIQE